MKKMLILLTVVFAFTACKNSWDDDDKKMFYQSCMDEANSWAGTKERAKTYCDCVMDKVMTKFPDESEALDHVDSVINDPDIRGCKTEVMTK